MFLDNDQLVHLQAMANAQAHFVVQQQSGGVPAEGNTEDQQDQHRSYGFSPYLPDNYEPYPYYQSLSQDEVAQYTGASDFPVFRGQVFSHQGPMELEGRVGGHDGSGVSGNNGTSGNIGATGTNAMVSSPSVEEEIARLQIADSDSDEPKHHKADIAAAAISSSGNSEIHDNSTNVVQDNNQSFR